MKFDFFVQLRVITFDWLATAPATGIFSRGKKLQRKATLVVALCGIKTDCEKTHAS